MTQHLSPSQLRAARGLLDWSRAELAKHTGVSEPTLQRFENGKSEPEPKTQQKLRTFLEGKGIEFLGDSGVQLKHHNVYTLEGVEGFKKLMDDVYAAACLPSAGDGTKPICIGNVNERLFTKYLGEHMDLHIKRMNDLKNVQVRALLSENDFYTFPGPYITYRWGPKQKSSDVPFYVWEDKLAVLMLDETHNLQIVVINSAIVAKAYREQFNMLWSLSKEVPRNRRLVS